jgi:hypothetical protein
MDWCCLGLVFSHSRRTARSSPQLPDHVLSQPMQCEWVKINPHLRSNIIKELSDSGNPWRTPVNPNMASRYCVFYLRDTKDGFVTIGARPSSIWARFLRHALAGAAFLLKDSSIVEASPRYMVASPLIKEDSAARLIFTIDGATTTFARRHMDTDTICIPNVCRHFIFPFGVRASLPHIRHSPP